MFCAVWVFVGSPSIAAPPATSPGATQPQDSGLITPTPDYPAGDPASCKAAHNLVPVLLKEISAQVDPATHAAVRKFVGGEGASVPLPKAWDDCGMALMMQGDPLGASWCGLNAITIQWTPDVVANCGVDLIKLGKNDEALALLNCAYASGDRSPYLFEAMATLYRNIGKKDKTIQWIDLAAASAPDDVFIVVEQSLAHTGAPPPASPPKPPASNADGLDEPLAELEAHARSEIRTIQNLGRKLDTIEKDPQTKKFRDAMLAIHIKTIEKFVNAARDGVKRARLTPEDYQKMFMHGNGTVDAKMFAGYQRTTRNMALLGCIEMYMMFTDELVQVMSGRSVDGPGWHALFWGNVLYMDPVALEQEMKQKYGGAKDHDGEIYSGNAASWGPLDHGLWITYWKAFDDSDKVRKNDEDICDKIKDDKACHDCLVKAEAANCLRVMAAYNEMAAKAKVRYDDSAHHFQLVARGEMMWGQRELADSRDYALRYLPKMKFVAASTRPYAAGQPSEVQGYNRVINVTWKALRERVLKVDHPTWSLAKYVHSEADAFTNDRASEMKNFATEWEAIAHGTKGSQFGGCEGVVKEAMDILAQEEWEDYLKELQSQLSEDFEAKYDPTVHCQSAIGPLTFTIDDTMKTTGEYKVEDALGGGIDLKRSLSTDRGKFAGGEVAAGAEAGEGVLVEGQTSVFVEKNERTGNWDAGFGVQGKLGLGVKAGMNVFGHKIELGIACYPGTVSAKFYARAAFDDAVSLVQAAINGPPAH